METKKIFYGQPEVIEAQRIAEIKALSYEQRLERMCSLMEISYLLKNATIVKQKIKK